MVRVYTWWFRFWALFLSAIHPKTMAHLVAAFFMGISRTFSATVRFVNADAKPELKLAHPVKHHEEVQRRRTALIVMLAMWIFVCLALTTGTGSIGRAFAAFKLPVAFPGFGVWGALAVFTVHVVVFVAIGRTDALMVKVQTARIAGESLIRSIVDDITLPSTARKDGHTAQIATPPAVLSTGRGYEVTVRVNGKGDPALLLAGSAKVAHKLQKDKRTVFVYEVRGSDLVRILILKKDPWSEKPSANPLVVSPRQLDLWIHDVDLGFRADYTRYLKRLQIEGDGGGILIGGKPRAGKSVFISNILVALMLDPMANIHMVDGSAVDYAMIRRRCTNYVGSEDMEDHELLAEAHAVLRELKTEIGRRKKILFAEGVSKLSPVLAQKYNLSTEWFIIDELAVITEDLAEGKYAKQVKEFIADLQWLVRGGPKFGVFAILATQRPSSGSVPSSIRGLISFRVAFYIADQPGSAAITGKAGPTNRADWLDPDQKGVAIVVSEGQIRAHLVETFDLSRVCSYAMSLRAQRANGVCAVSDDAEYPEPVRTMLEIMDRLELSEIPTEVLITELKALGHDRVTEKNLAESLTQFDISPVRFYLKDKTRKRGYLRETLERVPRTVYTPSASGPGTDRDTDRTGRQDGTDAQAANLDHD